MIRRGLFWIAALIGTLVADGSLGVSARPTAADRTAGEQRQLRGPEALDEPDGTDAAGAPAAALLRPANDAENEGSAASRLVAQQRVEWRRSAERRGSDQRPWQHVKVLGINDFHGQISTGRTVGGRPVGGAAVLAAYLKAAQAGFEDRTLIVHAGDHVGASPPSSALLQDEPAITFLNLLANRYCRYPERDRENGHDRARHAGEVHLAPAAGSGTPGGDRDPRGGRDRQPDGRGGDRDGRSGHRGRDRTGSASGFDPRCNIAGTLGNHEFDEGVAEMFRLIRGGNHPTGPFLEDPWRGARFPYVSANVVDDETGRPILPPYVVKQVAGVRIGIVGAVLEETPTIVTPSGVAGVRFLDEADAINASVRKLKAEGVRAILVLIHQGGSQTSYTGPTRSGETVTGAIVPIVARLDDEVDVVVSGHSHSFTNAIVRNERGAEILVVQSFSSGTAYSDIDLLIDPATGDVEAKSASIVTTWADEGPGLAPDPAAAALTAAAEQRVAPLVNRVVGTAPADVTRAENPAGESALGNLIADAQRAAMGTDLAFMNPGGIRADIAAGEVTWGDLFTVQPFANDLVRMDLTGAQIYTLLEQQWAGQPFPRILKPSGLTWVWDAARPVGSRVVAVCLGLVAECTAANSIDLTATLSVTVNSFMAAGGDNFTVLTQGTNRTVGPVDLDALVTYIEGPLGGIVRAEIEGRIRRLNE